MVSNKNLLDPYRVVKKLLLAARLAVLILVLPLDVAESLLRQIVFKQLPDRGNEVCVAHFQRQLNCCQ